MEIVEKPTTFVAVYMREQVQASPADVNRTRLSLMRFAQSRGLKVNGIYVEKTESSPQRFAAMNSRLVNADDAYLLIPGVHHLSGLGDNPLTILESFTKAGVQVLIAGWAD